MRVLVRGMQRCARCAMSGRDHDPGDGFLWGKRYRAREEKGGLWFLNCIVCGRDTSNRGESNGVYISGGGALIVHPEDYETYDHHGGDMGWFPVGAECIRRVPVEFRAANPYEDKVRGL